MANSIYENSMFEIFESISPNRIVLDLKILDYGRFMEKVLNIKEGGFFELRKPVADRTIAITITNADSNLTKILGGK